MEGDHNEVVISVPSHINLLGRGLVAIVTEYRADGCVTWKEL